MRVMYSSSAYRGMMPSCKKGGGSREESAMVRRVESTQLGMLRRHDILHNDWVIEEQEQAQARRKDCSAAETENIGLPDVLRTANETSAPCTPTCCI